MEIQLQYNHGKSSNDDNLLQIQQETSISERARLEQRSEDLESRVRSLVEEKIELNVSLHKRDRYPKIEECGQYSVVSYNLCPSLCM